MNALRLIEKPENREIRISLPEYFNDDLVEVIVLSIEKNNSNTAESRLNIAHNYLNQSKKSSFDLSKLDAHEQ
ncbi:hypothetical protein [Dyadobacter sediminis]|uniref:Uncharacterized protein n=1 Tax=Dyadobacter sediminis TaxID=1493691 RepID=A0A5R9K857_9BACT|nr:hypothetical protein [Dyadobacter sediminis]TLU90050.1 hypothetical protein FEM55_21265 [Dyadobacter sediminis]GGC10608.1 hypothetical protein GCM10011325_41750 [Dyadobacter sediminis]